MGKNSKPKREKSSAFIAWAYFAWLFGTFLFLILPSEVAGFSVLYAIGGEGTGWNDLPKVLPLTLLVPWLFIGWIYGGRRIDKYYRLRNRGETLNYFVLFSVLLYFLIMVGSLKVLSDGLKSQTTISGNVVLFLTFIVGLVVWSAVSYWLANKCLPKEEGSLYEKDANVYYNRGVVKENEGDWDGAIADYSKAIELKPTDDINYFKRGVAKGHKGDFDGAIADFTKAIELKPQDAINYFKRSVAKENKRDLDGAIADCTKAIELNPTFAIAYSNRGNAKDKKGDSDGAIADYTKAIELKPKFADAYTNRGNVKKAKGDQAGADTDFAQAAKIKDPCP